MMYWDRTVLKERAKVVLRQRYWITFGAVLVARLLGAGGSALSSNFRLNYKGNALSVTLPTGEYRVDTLTEMFGRYVPLILSAAAVAMVLRVLYTVFAGNAIEAGLCRFLWQNQREKPAFSVLFSGFQRGYLNTVKTLLLKDLYVFLWSLLFVIPGIVKGYSYFMVPYLLAENPHMSSERAFEISKRTTCGEKWEMFVLGLSFIGWSLLAMLTCGIGYIFLDPYMEATRAELYGALRYKALQTGVCSEWELQSV